jgi:hypothetical protein
VHYRDLSPAPRTSRRPAASAVSVQRARHVNAAPGTQWRPEREGARIPRAPSQAERNYAERVHGDRSQADRGQADRSHADRSQADRGHVDRSQADRSHADRSYSERIASYVDRAPIDYSHADRGQIELGRIGRIAADRSHANRSHVDRVPIDRSHVERGHVERNHAERSHVERSHVERKHVDRNIDRSHIRLEQEWRPAPRQTGLDRGVLLISAGLVAGAASCFWLLYNVFGAPALVAPPQAILQAPSTIGYGATEVVRSGKSDSLARSTRPMMQRMAEADAIGATDRIARAPVPDAPARPANNTGGPTRVTQAPSYFAPLKETRSKPLMQLAALENPAPRSRPAFDPIIPRIPPDGDPKTALIDFQTAPFPYDGRMPGSNRPFLDAGEAGHRGHTNFRGRVLWDHDTFGDPRVLLHIPPGFDANKPSVMIVFFHGHGATLARDVRDRQQVPAQISASGVNAVLVAPQFAVDAADSSPGKFGDPGGFKRFLDEAAEQLARLHGDPRTKQTFANMPIVIVAYSGGFGPTLAVLDNGGAKRIRGIVLLDALYSGINKFANWIAENRSGFFVSSYTPHTRGHNADLEQMLRAKSVSYGSELRRDHLAGSVTFLPAGPISHRDFVTHAWADLPLKDILVRLEEYDTRVQTATAALGSSPLAAVAAPSRSN